MPILLSISDDLKNAMKAKDEATLSTLRMLKSALKNKQIDLYGAEAKELSDDEVMAVVKTQIKQLKDAADTFAKGGRADMADSSNKEIAVLEKYLPAQMDDAALETAVKAALAEAGITSKADAGRAMGVAMKAAAGRADAGRVKKVVETVLMVLVLGFVLSSTAWAAGDGYSPVTYIAYALRTARAFTLLMGLVAVNTLISGSFAYMVAGGNDGAKDHAHHQMLNGLVGTLIVTALFAGLTVSLQQL